MSTWVLSHTRARAIVYVRVYGCDLHLIFVERDAHSFEFAPNPKALPVPVGCREVVDHHLSGVEEQWSGLK